MPISREKIKEVIERECRDTKRSTKLWSFLHYGLLFSATALSAAAASVLNLNTLFALSSGARQDYATLFSTIATVFAGIATAGNFASKWSASRMARSSLEQLRYLMLDDTCDLYPVQQRLIQIRRGKDVAFTQQVGRTSLQFQTGDDSGKQSHGLITTEKEPRAPVDAHQKASGSSAESQKNPASGEAKQRSLETKGTLKPLAEAVDDDKQPRATGNSESHSGSSKPISGETT